MLQILAGKKPKVGYLEPSWPAVSLGIWLVLLLLASCRISPWSHLQCSPRESYSLLWLVHNYLKCRPQEHLISLRHALYCQFSFSPGLGPLSQKSRKFFGLIKPLAKSRTLRLQSCFIHPFLIWREVRFLQRVSGVYSSPVLDTDELKMALRARKVSGAFEKRASGLNKKCSYEI